MKEIKQIDIRNAYAGGLIVIKAFDADGEKYIIEHSHLMRYLLKVISEKGYTVYQTVSQKVPRIIIND